MTTDTLTAEELYLLTHGAWCPKCGIVVGMMTDWTCTACKSDIHPGLLARCPETRPEGLEWFTDRGGRWMRAMPGEYGSTEHDQMSPSEVEERILGRLVKVAPHFEIGNGWCMIELITGYGPTKLYAAACAYHRWKDSHEAANGDTTNTVDATIKYAEKRYGDVLKRLADGPDQENP